ncbi:MAG: transposase [Methylococcaceae bacterium]|jgi:transposase-like protein
MKVKYSQEFREQAVQKTLNRGDRTIKEIVDELTINCYTLKHWLNHYRPEQMPTNPTAKRPPDWTNEEKLHALMASYGLKDEDLNAFYRHQGLFAHHLNSWKNDFINKHSPPNKPKFDKALRDEIHQLNQELSRKEKALAEAAALLIMLQKKFQAFWAEKAS